MVTHKEMAKALGAIYDGIADLRVEDDWVKEKWKAADALAPIIAALEAVPDSVPGGEPLAEGWAAKSLEGAWVVFLFKERPAGMPYTRRVAIYGVDE